MVQLVSNIILQHEQVFKSNYVIINRKKFI